LAWTRDAALDLAVVYSGLASKKQRCIGYQKPKRKKSEI